DDTHEGERAAGSGGRLVGLPGSGPGASARFVQVAPARVSIDEVPDEHGGFVYPEWDASKRRYRPRWCTVFERDIARHELRPLDRPPGDYALRRRLAHLGVGLERRRRQIQGDDLDLDAVVESRVQLAAHSTPDENVYVESQRRRRDLGVLVLIDVSGSTGDDSPYGGTIHDRQLVAAAQLIDTLNVLGDRVAAYGFRSRGRKAVEIVRVMTFDEPLDGLALERLGGLSPTAFTRMGAAIRHAAHLVESGSGTPRRLLVVLSDGLAYDDDYERAYGEADTRRALTEARERGVGCLCLSIGGGSDAEALRRVFGTSAHASAARLEDLRDIIGPLFRGALNSAESRRRLVQRSTRLGSHAARARVGAVE
ncbi:MAG: nitric oxide reductase activation protein NorD, partial [Actinomycetota bacterium]